MARRQVPENRKTLYFVGMGLSALGILLFLSTFVTFLWHFGDFTNFNARARSGGFRSFGGIVLIMLGGVLCGIAKRGVAGSGVVLDPERAREDMEPWSRMSGGMIGDALDEAGLDLRRLTDIADLPFDEKLRRLHALHEDGILSRDEYEQEKRDLLDRN